MSFKNVNCTSRPSSPTRLLYNNSCLIPPPLLNLSIISVVSRLLKNVPLPFRLLDTCLFSIPIGPYVNKGDLAAVLKR
ncbi:hypothetical protein KIN20_034534 [Parelaphostrongylus tenuis]|uniref:Uncharacterized protein n=1 Tax=Parelaphostrongylus tenuis TaxID=148309 RepID=A0AAD5R9T3_PARTN|nr:hypothetical protein KIN20_034534 [Parelaphostrongylus tenuis]